MAAPLHKNVAGGTGRNPFWGVDAHNISAHTIWPGRIVYVWPISHVTGGVTSQIQLNVAMTNSTAGDPPYRIVGVAQNTIFPNNDTRGDTGFIIMAGFADVAITGNASTVTPWIELSSNSLGVGKMRGGDTRSGKGFAMVLEGQPPGTDTNRLSCFIAPWRA